MQKGDKIHVDCTYDNDTGMTVPMGESSNQEMCFAISYRFPKLPETALGAVPKVTACSVNGFRKHVGPTVDSARRDGRARHHRAGREDQD